MSRANRAAAAIQRVADQAVSNANLPRNAAKGHWKHVSLARLFWLLLVEVWELLQAIRAYRKALRGYLAFKKYGSDCAAYHSALEDAWTELQKARRHIEYEAGDCVAFVAFILDRF